MGIGIGGGLGPFRGGMTSRGFGVGMGPLRIGTSWRSRDTTGCLGILILAAAISALASTVRDLVAWPLMAIHPQPLAIAGEVAYVALIAALILGLRQIRSHKRRAAERASASDTLRAREEGLATATQDLEQLVQTAREHPEGIDTSAHPLREGERFMFQMSSALVEPRVAQRHGPKVPTVVDHGTITVTNRSIRFAGSVKTAEWPAAKISDVTLRRDQLMLSVVGRKTLSGVSDDPPRLVPLCFAVAWSQKAAGSDEVDLDQVRGDLRDRLNELHAEVRQIRGTLRLPDPDESLDQLIADARRQRADGQLPKEA